MKIRINIYVVTILIINYMDHALIYSEKRSYLNKLENTVSMAKIMVPDHEGLFTFCLANIFSNHLRCGVTSV